MNIRKRYDLAKPITTNCSCITCASAKCFVKRNERLGVFIDNNDIWQDEIDETLYIEKELSEPRKSQLKYLDALGTGSNSLATSFSNESQFKSRHPSGLLRSVLNDSDINISSSEQSQCCYPYDNIRDQNIKNVAREDLPDVPYSQLQSINNLPNILEVHMESNKLTAQVMDIPYNRKPLNSLSHIFKDKIREMSSFDIFQKLQEIYKACSCKICSCVPAFTNTQNQLCDPRQCKGIRSQQDSMCDLNRRDRGQYNGKTNNFEVSTSSDYGGLDETKCSITKRSALKPVSQFMDSGVCCTPDSNKTSKNNVAKPKTWHPVNYPGPNCACISQCEGIVKKPNKYFGCDCNLMDGNEENNKTKSTTRSRASLIDKNKSSKKNNYKSTTWKPIRHVSPSFDRISLDIYKSSDSKTTKATSWQPVKRPEPSCPCVKCTRSQCKGLVKKRYENSSCDCDLMDDYEEKSVLKSTTWHPVSNLRSDNNRNILDKYKSNYNKKTNSSTWQPVRHPEPSCPCVKCTRSQCKGLVKKRYENSGCDCDLMDEYEENSVSEPATWDPARNLRPGNDRDLLDKYKSNDNNIKNTNSPTRQRKQSIGSGFDPISQDVYQSSESKITKPTTWKLVKRPEPSCPCVKCTRSQCKGLVKKANDNFGCDCDLVDEYEEKSVSKSTIWYSESYLRKGNRSLLNKNNDYKKTNSATWQPIRHRIPGLDPISLQILKSSEINIRKLATWHPVKHPEPSCPCVKCTRSQCKGLVKKANESLSCDCDLMYGENKMTKSCDCLPCQCTGCRSTSLKSRVDVTTSVFSANVQEYCMNVSKNSTVTVHEISTGISKHSNCPYETCLDELCEPDSCRYEKHNFSIEKLTGNTSEHKIDRANVGTNVALCPTIKPFKNATIAVFSSVSVNPSFIRSKIKLDGQQRNINSNLDQKSPSQSSINIITKSCNCSTSECTNCSTNKASSSLNAACTQKSCKCHINSGDVESTKCSKERLSSVNFLIPTESNKCYCTTCKCLTCIMNKSRSNDTLFYPVKKTKPLTSEHMIRDHIDFKNRITQDACSLDSREPSTSRTARKLADDNENKAIFPKKSFDQNSEKIAKSISIQAKITGFSLNQTNGIYSKRFTPLKNPKANIKEKNKADKNSVKTKSVPKTVNSFSKQRQVSVKVPYSPSYLSHQTFNVKPSKITVKKSQPLKKIETNTARKVYEGLQNNRSSQVKCQVNNSQRLSIIVDEMKKTTSQLKGVLKMYEKSNEQFVNISLILQMNDDSKLKTRQMELDLDRKLLNLAPEDREKPINKLNLKSVENASNSKNDTVQIKASRHKSIQEHEINAIYEGYRKLTRLVMKKMSVGELLVDLTVLNKLIIDECEKIKCSETRTISTNQVSDRAHENEHLRVALRLLEKVLFR